jgi:hypothetical protein
MISQEMPIRSANRPADEARLAFLYEHPHWFAQIFAELERPDAFHSRKSSFPSTFMTLARLNPPSKCCSTA